MSNTFLKSVVGFTKNVKTTGALFQTSKKIEQEICSKINEDTKVVVEFGTGLGNITRRILSTLPPDGRLYSFEVNAEFLEDVKEIIQDERLVLINDGAQNFQKYISEEVDCFISSIPLTILPKEVRDEALSKSYESLKSGGSFSQILYSVQKKKFDVFFDKVEIETVFSVPTFVHHCWKQ